MAWYKKANKKQIPNEKVESKIQDQWIAHIGDTQKWPTDSYDCIVCITETNYKITISVTIQTVHTGTVMYQLFWKYGLDEKSRAKKTYKEVIEKISNIISEITLEEMPSCLFEGMTRTDCSLIDSEKIAKTTVPHINWSQKIKYERDWRSSLYGNRYPKPTDFNGF